ncbi:hypothetical protein DVH24_025967 [Malus domestica]|uniref:Uncharacterized protein n=1 Tax=Malus domestica TaxID=3750 RepID=A0A498KI35_MALDO|nr:hypothetical protein DVH24_025967 [Malus domestica]
MLLRALLLLSVGYFTYPLTLLSTYMILRLYIFFGVCEKYLDMVLTLVVQSLVSSEDVMAVRVCFMLLEIRVFLLFIVAAFRPMFVRPSRYSFWVLY